MEGLTRNDVVRFRDSFYVVVESHLLPPDPGVVTIPLMQGYPAVGQLNPIITFRGQNYVLATRMIAALRRARLEKVGDISGQGDAVTRAIDILMSGV